jgi:hypothetical protein
LKRQLAKYGTPASSAINLWDLVLEEWWKIEDKPCLHLIDSLPNPIEAVINAKGGVTRF